MTAVPWMSSQTTENATVDGLAGTPSGSTATLGRIWLPAASALACPVPMTAPAGDTTR